MNWPFPHIKPREVQLEALNKGYGKVGFGYLLRQRLGKTFLTIAEYTLLREEGKVDWLLIICPNSLKPQWEEQLEYCDPFLPVCIYSSQGRKSIDHFLKVNKTGGVIIINYESVAPFMRDEYWKKFNVNRTYIVADESTKIKEPTNKLSKACYELASVCAYKRILTGKPRANSNADLWGQLKFIDGTKRNFYQHKYTFSVMGGYMGRTVVKDINTHMLQEEMKPITYIAPDKYVKGFEKVYEPLRRVELNGELKRLYKEMEDSLVFELSEGVNISAPIILTKYLRLQQISSGLAGDEDGNIHNLIEPRDNPRIKAVCDILENEVPNKCIIVCRFKRSIENLYEVLTDIGYNCAVMRGGMGSELEEQKRIFNTDDTVNILLAQTQVLNFGHTLPGNKNNRCDSMIFFENDFSLINRAQCESRPEDADDQVPISYFDLYSSKMDRYILESLIKKEDASLALMNYQRSSGILSTTTFVEKETVNDLLL